MLKKLAPNVDWAALIMGCLAIVVGVLLMMVALDVIHQPDSTFPSGRGPAVVCGLVFIAGGLFMAVSRGLGETKPLLAFRRSLASGLVGIMMLAFAAIPGTMLVIGTEGQYTISSPLPFFAYSFHSHVLDKFVLSAIAGFCALIAFACFKDFFRYLKLRR